MLTCLKPACPAIAQNDLGLMTTVPGLKANVKRKSTSDNTQSHNLQRRVIEGANCNISARFRLVTPGIFTRNLQSALLGSPPLLRPENTHKFSRLQTQRPVAVTLHQTLRTCRYSGRRPFAGRKIFTRRVLFQRGGFVTRGVSLCEEFQVYCLV